MLTEMGAWPVVIQLHAGAAILALVLGPFAIWRRRKDIWHRLVGVTWIVLMLVVATTAWFIHGWQLIGPFSPIHLFSLLTYYSIFEALQHARAGRYREHGATLRGLYLQALGIAGLFTLLPGRRMHQLIFGDDVVSGLVVMACLGVGLVLVFRQKPDLRFVR